MYPSTICSYNIAPIHLGQNFVDVYSEIREKRLKAKHSGDKLTDATYKLSLNGQEALLFRDE